jgi:hypothetical protein
MVLKRTRWFQSRINDLNDSSDKRICTTVSCKINALDYSTRQTLKQTLLTDHIMVFWSYADSLWRHVVFYLCELLLCTLWVCGGTLRLFFALYIPFSIYVTLIYQFNSFARLVHNLPVICIHVCKNSHVATFSEDKMSNLTLRYVWQCCVYLIIRAFPLSG